MSRSPELALPDLDPHRSVVFDEEPSVEPSRYTISGDAGFYRPTLGDLTLGGSSLDPDAEHGNSSSTDGKQGRDRVLFGRFVGITARCILSILGVPLFVRTGWLVGGAGIPLACAIIGLCVLCSFMTVLSMSAISTNGKVQGGGAYFLISRSLGARFGGAIGVVFALANSAGAAMHTIGLCEIFLEVTEISWFGDWTLRVVALIAITILLVMLLIGIGWVLKLQMFLLVCLLIAISSVVAGSFTSHSLDGFTGYSFDTLKGNWGSNFGAISASFASALAVMFSGAGTGIMAGANISGDLKDASKDLPAGTLQALSFTTGVYMVLIWIIGSTVKNSELVSNNAVLFDTSLLSILTWIGLFSSALSSAIAMLVGAPRVLQSVSADRIIPALKLFGRGVGPENEPYNAYFLCYAIACLFIILGNLNAVAPFVSIFFLLSYALVNLSCLMANLTKFPGWRPSFRHFNNFTATLGVVLSIGFIILINQLVASICFVSMGLLFIYLHFSLRDRARKGDVMDWGDCLAAGQYSSAIKSLYHLNGLNRLVNPKLFRPNMLLIVDSVTKNEEIVQLAYALVEKANSFNILAHIRRLEHEEDWADVAPAIASERSALTRFVDREQLKMTPEVITARTFHEGVRNLLQLSGVSLLRPAVAVLGFPRHWDTKTEWAEEWVRSTRDICLYNSGIAVLRQAVAPQVDHHSDTEILEPDTSVDIGQIMIDIPNNLPPSEPEIDVDSLELEGRCDIYWLVDDGGLSVLLPYTLSRKMRNLSVRVYLTGHPQNMEREGITMQRLIEAFRIRCEVQYIDPKDLKGWKSEMNPDRPLSPSGCPFSILHPPAKPTEGGNQQIGAFALFGSMPGVIEETDELDDENAISPSLLLPIRETLEDYQTHKENLQFLLEETDDILVASFERDFDIEVPEVYRSRTARLIRLAAVTRFKSGDAAICFIPMPLPRPTVPSKLFLAWSHLLTCHNDKPVVLIRGNGKPVLTTDA